MNPPRRALICLADGAYRHYFDDMPSSTRRLPASTLRVLVVSALIAGSTALGAGAASATLPTDPNPTLDQSCGLDLTLVLDASGSIQSSHAVDSVRSAASTLLDSLGNTNSTARVTQFASLSEELAPRGQVDTTSLAQNGALGKAVAKYYNPIPRRPGNVNIHSYNSGNYQSSGSYRLANGSNQYTNWDQGLDQAGTDAGELVVFVTDGDPTGFDLNKPSDPFDAGPPPDVAVNTNKGSANDPTIDRAVEEANQIKASGGRVLAIGVGSALTSNSSINRLKQISGPQVVRDADLGSIDSLNDIDVALVRNFDDLSAFMRGLVLELCSPSLTIRKLAQTRSDPTFTPRQAWPMTVTPSVPGGSGFSWILPDTSAAASKTQDTDANGYAQFQWEPSPPEEDSVARVVEGTKPNFVSGRPGANNDYRCEARNEAGDVRLVSGDFADPSNPAFDLDPIAQEVVTCTVYNSFDYQPDIALAKVNAPTEIRGDLSPPSSVTSRYLATNPGNTPLLVAGVTDDQCAPVRPVRSGGSNAGDTDGDGRLDPGESWQYSCDRALTGGAASSPPQQVVNTAEVVGTDPEGTRVTATATDDVDLYSPAIMLDKTVDGGDRATIAVGASVTYGYAVTNAGNTPLGSVGLVDDTPPCTAPTRGSDSPGNDDATLDVGETWTYSCSSSPVRDVVNTALVTGTPLNPAAGNSAFPTPNPQVSDTDVAQVVVVNASLDLVKSASPTTVLLAPGASPPAEPVTYTFDVANTGGSPLAREDGSPAKTPGWIADARCTSPASYSSGDVNTDDIFDNGETWTFTCQGSVAQPTVNVATIRAVPADASGTPVPGGSVIRDRAKAFVDVRQPDIDITKKAFRPVVLDPDADPVAGPDTPSPRQATYGYLVTNPGDVALSLVSSPPADDKCGPVSYLDGDGNSNSLLDPGEVWAYVCLQTLEREDANVPPGDRSGLVRNTVSVTGIPVLAGTPVPGKSVTATDRANVLVVEPGLSLKKAASASVVRDGDEVTYTIKARNTGDVDLTLGKLSDDKCSPLDFQGGDTDGDGRLDGANSTPEVWTWTCTRRVFQPVAPDTRDVNRASVTAFDTLGNEYRASDKAAVEVITPAIALTKVPDKLLVPSGTRVSYDFEVTNVGTSDLPANDVLEEVQLADASDPAAPSCLQPTLVSKSGGNNDNRLERDPSEVWTYRCATRIDEETVNVGVVGAIGGRPSGLEYPVFDFDVAFVGVFHPEIEVQKSSTPTKLTGSGTVTYTYEVENTGDVPLADVTSRISDDTCAPVTYVSGDEDGDGLLDTPRSIFEDRSAERWTFTCATTVSEDTVNVVTVKGSPSGPEGQRLCGSTSEPFLVQTPCDVRAHDRASVTVEGAGGPGTGSGGGNPGNPGTETGGGDSGGPGMPRTGISPWVGRALAAALLMIGVGGAMVGIGGRRRMMLDGVL